MARKGNGGLLSRKVRKHFNLPLKGKIGLTRKEQKELIRQHAVFCAKKGKDAEDRFIKAWEDQRDLRSGYKGFISIRRATREEDQNEKTDAFLEIKKLGTLRIQIKSYYTNAGDFFEFCKKGIVLVSVLPDDMPQTILDNTVALVTRYHFFRTYLFSSKPTL